MTLEEELLAVMKKHLVKEETYINPRFLDLINGALYDFYKLEDDEVDDMIMNMWSW